MVVRNSVCRNTTGRMDDVPLKTNRLAAEDKSFNGKPQATAFCLAASHSISYVGTTVRKAVACGLPLNELAWESAR